MPQRLATGGCRQRAELMPLDHHPKPPNRLRDESVLASQACYSMTPTQDSGTLQGPPESDRAIQGNRWNDDGTLSLLRLRNAHATRANI